jgi:hypothetical protein
MDATKIEAVLRGLDCRGIKVRLHRNKVEASCPLARYRHQGGEDKHPSFVVTIDRDAPSTATCQACGLNGMLSHIVLSVAKRSGRDLNALLRLTSERVSGVKELPAPPPKPKLHTNWWHSEPPKVAGVQISVSFAEAMRKSITETILPESERLIYKSLSKDAEKYLKGPQRRLLASTIDAWELGWNWKNRRVMIPIRNGDWKLVALSGRAIDPGVRPTYMHSKGFHRDYYLYGEHRIQAKGGRGILVEGFFDVMGLWQKGYPGAVAMMGTWLSDLQTEKIVSLFKELVIIPDGDAPGFEAAARIQAQLKNKISVRIVEGVPKDMDPDSLPSEFLFNELGPPVLLDNQSAAK